MADTTRLRLPYLAAAQSQKHVTHNDALQVLDGIVHLAVVERGVAAPPPAASEGDRYLVGEAPTGAFADHAGALACLDDGAWRFHEPRIGWIAFVQAESALCVFDGTDWQDVAGLLRLLSGLTGLGIGTAPDEGHPFAARINAGYFVARPKAEGGSGDLRLAIGKEAVGRTASQIYQTAWSGRAETGLVGDDSFRIKVSADGASWRDSLVVDPASGAVRFPSGIAEAAGTSLGGLRNLVVNGDFSIAQRGAGPFALATGTVWTFDRWAAISTGVATGTVSRAPSSADGPPGQVLKIALTAVAAGAGVDIVTRLEDVARLAGRLATVSFWYRSPASAFTMSLEQQFGTGGSAPVVVSGPSALAAASVWTRFAVTVAVPSVTQKAVKPDSALAMRLRFTGAAPASLEIAAVQIEEGPVATPFEQRPTALELVLARRFLRVSSTALNASDLALEMRATPVVSGAGPFVYSAEL